jgi:hypothetical protein
VRVRKFLLAGLLVGAGSVSVLAVAASPANASSGPRCTQLQDEYDNASMLGDVWFGQWVRDVSFGRVYDANFDWSAFSYYDALREGYRDAIMREC